MSGTTGASEASQKKFNNAFAMVPAHGELFVGVDELIKTSTAIAESDGGTPPPDYHQHTNKGFVRGD